MTAAVNYSTMQDVLLECSIGTEAFLIEFFPPCPPTALRQHGGMQAIFTSALWHVL